MGGISKRSQPSASSDAHVGQSLLDNFFESLALHESQTGLGADEGQLQELLLHHEAPPQYVQIPLALGNVLAVAQPILVHAPDPVDPGYEVSGHVQGRVQGDGHPAIQTHRRIKNAVEVAERDVALGLVVDEEAQSVSDVQVQEKADCRTLLDATLGALGVTTTVHEPGTLAVDVHAPAPVVLAWKQREQQERIEMMYRCYKATHFTWENNIKRIMQGYAMKAFLVVTCSVTVGWGEGRLYYYFLFCFEKDGNRGTFLNALAGRIRDV